MEIFKDGKYIIGFLVGVICSFIIMSGIENYKNPEGEELSQSARETVVNEQQQTGEEETQFNTEGGSVSANVVSDGRVTKPEEPNSPELQRLALILRETEKMVERLKKEMASIIDSSQTANLFSQN